MENLDPAADDDGDGFTNGQEQQAGTNPLEAREYFRLTGLISFPTVAGRQYVVEYREDLRAGAWQPLLGGSAVTGNGTVMSVTDPDATGRAHRYYRVRLAAW
jgi:hypothetical protein